LAALLLGALLKRFTKWAWLPLAALATGLSAWATRAALLAQIGVPHHESHMIDLWRIVLATSSVSWGALATLWGIRCTVGGSRSPPGPAGARARWLERGAGITSTCLGLYALAPLWLLLGLRLDHWTGLGLFGLALACYGISLIHETVARRLGRR
jgi:hypothetical protein